jgi:hypothetical protein
MDKINKKSSSFLSKLEKPFYKNKENSVTCTNLFEPEKPNNSLDKLSCYTTSSCELFSSDFELNYKYSELPKKN